jgi:hypothetical protein
MWNSSGYAGNSMIHNDSTSLEVQEAKIKKYTCRFNAKGHPEHSKKGYLLCSDFSSQAWSNFRV